MALTGLCLGGCDVSEEQIDGSNCLGGEYSQLGLVIQHRHTKPRTWRTSLAAAAKSSILSPWVYVHNILRIPYLRELAYVCGRSWNSTRRINEELQSFVWIYLLYFNINCANRSGSSMTFRISQLRSRETKTAFQFPTFLQRVNSEKPGVRTDKETVKSQRDCDDKILSGVGAQNSKAVNWKNKWSKNPTNITQT